MAEIRQRFWIPALRQVTRKIVHECMVCKKIEGKPFRSKPQPPLPDFRVKPSNPFSYCAIDFAGPLYIRKSESKRSPSMKSYIALITCASTRALHLELTPDLSAEALTRSLRRFISRRSCPNLIISDNAKTFSAQSVKDFLTDRGIDWHFNVPKAPWQNGIVERLVKSTKRCLKKKLGRARLTFEELQTVISEIECAINNRPLTYIDNDTIESCITPNHLCNGRRMEMFNSSSCGSEDADRLSVNNLTKRVVYREYLVKHFLKRWEKEYLLTLREKYQKDGSSESFKNGDIVLIKDDGPRLFWKIAKIVELRKSKDGETRAATLRLGKKGNNATELVRPIEALYPLELECDTKDNTAPIRPEENDLFSNSDGDTDSESNDTLDSDTE